MLRRVFANCKILSPGGWPLFPLASVALLLVLVFVSSATAQLVKPSQELDLTIKPTNSSVDSLLRNFDTKIGPSDLAESLPDDPSIKDNTVTDASSNGGIKANTIETGPGYDLQKEMQELKDRLKNLEDQAKATDSMLQQKSRQDWEVKLGGHIQTDYITWADTHPNITDPAAVNYFSFRRLRLLADGKGYQNYDFRLQMTLEPGEGPINSNATPDVKDAYVSINEIPLIGRLRLGNFFVPFSLEQVTNDTNNIFLERSIPSQGIFAVEREVGIAAYNCNPDQTLTWTSGLFFDNLGDTVKTRSGDRQGYRISGRGTWLPYYSAEGRYLIHTGVGGLYTRDQDRFVRLSARPQIQKGPVLIDTGNLAADHYRTGNLEIAVVWGQTTIQSEAFLSQIDQLSGQNVNVGGAYAHLSYFITGENRIFERFGQHGSQFARNKPSRNFLISQSGISPGAWEFKTRWSYLDLTDANAGQYNDLTVGINWYWSDRMRIMFDWIQPYTDTATRFGSTNSDLIGMRFDVNW